MKLRCVNVEVFTKLVIVKNTGIKTCVKTIWLSMSVEISGVPYETGQKITLKFDTSKYAINTANGDVITDSCDSSTGNSEQRKNTSTIVGNTWNNAIEFGATWYFTEDTANLNLHNHTANNIVNSTNSSNAEKSAVFSVAVAMCLVASYDVNFGAVAIHNAIKYGEKCATPDFCERSDAVFSAMFLPTQMKSDDL